MELRSRNKVDASFSMSSMTDIVFLLLIFFIVISTFVSPYGLDIDLPRTKADQNPIRSNIIVEITESLSYKINGEAVSYEVLMSTLRNSIQPNETPSLILMADAKVDWETGMQVVAEAKSIGFSKIVVRTKPK